MQRELGLEDRKLTVHLYKLLIYEKGGFFLPHRDGEKLDRMVATLVIVLPSVCEAGELILWHDYTDITNARPPVALRMREVLSGDTRGMDKRMAQESFDAETAVTNQSSTKPYPAGRDKDKQSASTIQNDRLSVLCKKDFVLIRGNHFPWISTRFFMPTHGPKIPYSVFWLLAWCLLTAVSYCSY